MEFLQDHILHLEGLLEHLQQQRPAVGRPTNEFDSLGKDLVA